MIVGEIFVNKFPSQDGKFQLEVAYKVTAVTSEFKAEVVVIGVTMTDPKTGELVHEMAGDDVRLST